MIVIFKTGTHHGNDKDGSERQEHCCGCFNVVLDRDQPLKPYLQCNECSEIFPFPEPKVLQEHD